MKAAWPTRCQDHEYLWRLINQRVSSAGYRKNHPGADAANSKKTSANKNGPRNGLWRLIYGHYNGRCCECGQRISEAAKWKDPDGWHLAYKKTPVEIEHPDDLLEPANFYLRHHRCFEATIQSPKRRRIRI
jgi:hypothetical protein